MSERKYIVSCPICGKILCKAWSGSAVEMLCPKCKSELRIELVRGQVLVKESSAGMVADKEEIYGKKQ